MTEAKSPYGGGHWGPEIRHIPEEGCCPESLDSWVHHLLSVKPSTTEAGVKRDG